MTGVSITGIYMKRLCVAPSASIDATWWSLTLRGLVLVKALETDVHLARGRSVAEAVPALLHWHSFQGPTSLHVVVLATPHASTLEMVDA